ncbi:MAG: NnrU family protein [Rhodobacteraceae bacterium]|nr:NnrU family protein [Paracoccaceae bacterium]
MTILILGVALWWAAHLFKRIAPERRAAMGEAGKGFVAVLSLAAIVLMVYGYRQADFVPVYTPVPGLGHLTAALMLVAVFLLGVGGTKGILYPRMRHPMLTGVVVWAVAHLLVRGDLAAIVLFGGMGLWAIMAMVLINRAGPRPVPADGRGLRGDAMNLVGTAVAYAVIVLIHQWILGHSLFAGV